MAFDGVPYDEAAAHPEGYASLLRMLGGADLMALSRAVARELEVRGVGFGDGPFIVDPIPRLIPAGEWQRVVAGLTQRTRALNRFLVDAYGEQRAVAEGAVPAEVMNGAEGFEPDLLGRLPSTGAPAAIIGYDLVREPGGEFLVLEDNARTPSGFEYAAAAREALEAVMPSAGLRPRPLAPDTRSLLDSTLQAAAPAGSGSPSIVILTDGPGNVAYAEHRRAAARIDVPLVTLDQLWPHGDRLRVRLPGDEIRNVDVVYRRCDEDRLRDDAGQLTAVARKLLPAWLSGHLGLVNAFGNGLADDKLAHAYLEDLIRYYLGEEPLLRSVPTRDLADPGQRAVTLDRLHEHVVKPRHGHGGNGVVIGATASADELARLAEAIRLHPDRYISQPVVSLSEHPTVIAGRLVSRHVDLRAFAFCAPDIHVLPGGLSRFARQEGQMVVNSSQDGGGKDTWIVD